MALESDGPVDLIDPFEKLGRRMVRDWSPSHVSAALPGQRSKFSRKVHSGAWETLFELSRYAREGVLPLYPYGRVEASERISPSLVWLIYPLYSTSKQSSRGRGLVELVDGAMIEAVADITSFKRVYEADHPPLPRMGRPQKYPDYFFAAMAFWQANPGMVKTGVVIEHIKTHEPMLDDAVPKSSRYRLVDGARVAAREVG
ncbi:hypothetical protein ACFOWX_02910 [Sphingorhabdus arenilitoris]|uniref:Uncharacterized protein n=1 Tax=Sphingorhabdus arenilitoris TaxID=1490041 RepID=A0ABV8RDQ1_9SPHN